MALFESVVIPRKHRAKFTAAVAARRALNEAIRKASEKGQDPPAAAINRHYRAMNALPLWLQPVAEKRGSK